MIEVTEKRDYKISEFVEDNGDKIFRIYAGDIFYDNKLAVGDGVAGFRKIDNTLIWDETLRGWTFKFHNYRPFLPEYADDWFSYRDLYKDKDQTTRFRPVCDHVQGQLLTDIPGVTDQNAILYQDAFGKGIDLIIKFTFRKMIKLVRVREEAKPDTDLVFDFEMELPSGKEISFDGAVAKIGISESLQSVNASDFTCILPSRAWDSGEPGENSGMLCELIPNEFLPGKENLLFRKTIPVDFLKRSTGDIFTDATFTYSETKDTYYGTSYTTGGNPDGPDLWYGGWGDQYYSFLEWDLSTVPVGSIVKLARIALCVTLVPPTNPSLSYYRITSSWTEAGVTSSSNPTYASPAFAVPAGTMTLGYDFTNISGQVRNWRSGFHTNYGLTVRAASNNNTRGSYASSDNSDVNKQPYIEVTTGIRSAKLSMGRVGS